MCRNHLCQFLLFMKIFIKAKVMALFFLAFLPLFATAGDRPAISVMSFDELAPLLNRKTDSIYVINFWATWCAPCLREIPAFEKLNEVYGKYKVKVILVSLDFPNHLQSRVIPFLNDMDVKSQVILLDERNPNRWIPLVNPDWTGAIPATIIYSQDFNGFYQREFYFEELEELIKPLITKIQSQ